MIHVIAVITTKPGKIIGNYCLQYINMPGVKAEKGCIEYGPVVDADDMGPIQTPFGEDTFVVIEKWETKGDLKSHAAAPHMAAYAAKVKDLLASRIIHVMTDA